MRFTSTDALTKMIYLDFYTAVEMEANSASELGHASSPPSCRKVSKIKLHLNTIWKYPILIPTSASESEMTMHQLLESSIFLDIQIENLSGQ